MRISSYTQTMWIIRVLFNASYARNLVQWPKQTKEIAEKNRKNEQKTASILRFYISRRHKRIWHFDASSPAVFLFVVFYSIPLETIRWLKFLLSLSFEPLEHNSHLQMDFFHLKSNWKDENKKNELCSENRAFLLLSETVSMSLCCARFFYLSLLGQFITLNIHLPHLIRKLWILHCSNVRGRTNDERCVLYVWVRSTSLDVRIVGSVLRTYRMAWCAYLWCFNSKEKNRAFCCDCR